MAFCPMRLCNTDIPTFVNVTQMVNVMPGTVKILAPKKITQGDSLRNLRALDISCIFSTLAFGAETCTLTELAKNNLTAAHNWE